MRNDIYYFTYQSLELMVDVVAGFAMFFFGAVCGMHTAGVRFAFLCVNICGAELK